MRNMRAMISFIIVMYPPTMNCVIPVTYTGVHPLCIQYI